MQRILSLVIVAALLGGCTDDDPDDPGGADDGANNGGGTGTGTMTGTQGQQNETRETVQVTVTWSGLYRVNGAYTPSEVRVPANSTVELTFVNNEQNPIMGHDLDVEGISGANGPVIDPGQAASITFDVGAPLTTAFFCSVGDHRANGMEGTFIVE